MNIETIIKELRAEKQRIDAALTVLVGTPISASPELPTPTVVASPAVPVAVISHHRKGRHLSAAVKSKIAVAQTARWATVHAVNLANAARATSAKALASTRRSKAQKLRWAGMKAAAAAEISSALTTNLTAMDGHSATVAM